jgi:hypothetical protein
VQGRGWLVLRGKDVDAVDGSLTQVPHLKLDILVSDRFNVEADGWGGRDSGKESEFWRPRSLWQMTLQREKGTTELWGFAGGGGEPGAKRGAASDRGMRGSASRQGCSLDRKRQEDILV